MCGRDFVPDLSGQHNMRPVKVFVRSPCLDYLEMAVLQESVCIKKRLSEHSRKNDFVPSRNVLCNFLPESSLLTISGYIHG